MEPAQAKVKLGKWPININERAEVQAFVEGFRTCMLALDEFVKASPEKDKELYILAYDLAKHLYPDYDPPPQARKRAENGNRLDGITFG